MSGPKCDEYSLCWEEAQRIMNQADVDRQREQERLRQVQEAQREARRKAALEAERQRKEALEKKRLEEEQRRLDQEQRDQAAAFDSEADQMMAEMEEIARRKKEETVKAAETEQVVFDQAAFNAFEDLYIRYQAAANLIDEEPQTFEYHPENADSVMAYMNQEAARMEQELNERRQHAEVNRIIDETIMEMGYQVLAQHDDDGDQAYLYDYDGKTALSILNTGNQFVMEVVAVDDKDRRATEEEKEELYGKMESFCDSYKELRDRLEADGRLNRKGVYHMKPDKKYARVINRNTYEERAVTRGRSNAATRTGRQNKVGKRSMNG